MFSLFLAQRFRSYVAEQKLDASQYRQQESCSLSEDCKQRLAKGLSFIDKINIMYPARTTDGPFLAERPDFYLGRFLSMFEDVVTSKCVRLKEKKFGDETSQIMYEMIKSYFGVECEFGSLFSAEHLPCIDQAEQLLQKDYKMFVQLVKLSEMTHGSMADDEKQFLNDKFISSSFFFPNTTYRDPIYLKQEPKKIHFCHFDPSNLLKSKKHHLHEMDCNLSKPIVTPNGLCQSFNSFTMDKVFKSSTVASTWSSVLYNNKEDNEQIFRPTGHGNGHGLKIVLNGFEALQSNKNRSFILAITNEHNPYDIYKDKFVLKPGFAYTFKVTANLLSTTDEFDKLSNTYRTCNLPHDSNRLNIFTVYSKSNCEFECAINYVKDKLECVPWNIPRIINDNKKYCNHKESQNFRYGTNAINVLAD